MGLWNGSPLSASNTTGLCLGLDLHHLQAAQALRISLNRYATPCFLTIIGTKMILQDLLGYSMNQAGIHWIRPHACSLELMHGGEERGVGGSSPAEMQSRSVLKAGLDTRCLVRLGFGNRLRGTQFRLELPFITASFEQAQIQPSPKSLQ